MAKTSLGLLEKIMKMGNSSGIEDCFPTMVLTITNLRNKIRDIYSKFVKNVFKNLSQCPALSENLYNT